jgi:uncharacterized protein YndB with AHSA1/START domain
MSDYTESIFIERPAERVFAYLSDVSTIPEYMPRLSRAEPRGDGVVEVTAHPMIAPGRQVTVEGTAWTKVGDDSRTFSWGSHGGRHDYRGEFEVEALERGCLLTVRLHTTSADGSPVARGLADTLAKIKQVAESWRD